MDKHVLLLTTFILLAFGVIMGLLVQASDTPLTLLSQASEQKTADCPINATYYIKEIDEKGQEIPLNLDNYPESDPRAWTITDGQNVDVPLYFNQLPLLRYALDVEATNTNRKGDVTFLKLTYPTDQFRIVKNEILTCASPQNPHLCTAPQAESADELDVIGGITLDCNMTLEAGWVVQKILSVKSQTIIPLLADCDLNNDGACNTFDLFLVIDDYGKEARQLIGDLNHDGRVNALDYTLLTSSISLL